MRFEEGHGITGITRFGRSFPGVACKSCSALARQNAESRIASAQPDVQDEYWRCFFFLREEEPSAMKTVPCHTSQHWRFEVRVCVPCVARLSIALIDLE
jgi:hypothetical protein